MPPAACTRKTYPAIPLRPVYNATKATQSTAQEDFL